MSQAIETIQSLIKALEAGSYDVAPSKLVQGAALQVEDLSSVIKVTTFGDEHIKLQKDFKVESCKSMLAQFDRQLDYGQFGGSATLEGMIGQEETSQYVRVTVPMCFYSHTRKVTLQSMMVQTVDGKKSDERAASDAAKKLSADIEFDLFRGKADFTNNGVFDGHMMAIHPGMPNMLGVDVQIRQSDILRNTQDLMFNEYGSDESVVIAGGSTLSQENIEDAWVRSQMNFGNAKRLLVDPKVQSNHNKIGFAKERIVLAGSPQSATGSDLSRQWVSGGVVNLEASRFLSGKTSPAPARPNGPAAPTSITLASTTVAGVATGFIAGQKYKYYATTGNEIGESVRTATVEVTVAADGDVLDVTINHPASGTAMYFNVYRSVANASVLKYIGRVRVSVGSSSTVFRDLGNKQPGFVTGFLLEDDAWTIRELSPFSRLKLAVTSLNQPEAFFRFLCLAGERPRQNVLIDNLR